MYARACSGPKVFALKSSVLYLGIEAGFSLLFVLKARETVVAKENGHLDL